jgi:predicted nucleic acid-binding protein
MQVIVDSSPIISLASVNQLHLLEKLYQKVIIPKAVYDEIYFKEHSNIISSAIDGEKYIEVKNVKNIEAENLFSTALHKGEVEVMILYRELQADLCIIDDYLARKYAQPLKIKVTGTIGILMASKEKGFIKE